MPQFLKRSSHGGFCCGMTHIYTFPFNPDSLCGERKRETPEAWKKARSENPFVGLVYNDYQPTGRAGDRLRNVIKEITEGDLNVSLGRSKGIVEVVLTLGQVKEWEGLLTELGFVCVNTAKNSNSGNTINVYHLVTGVAPKAKVL